MMQKPATGNSFRSANFRIEPRLIGEVNSQSPFFYLR